MDVGASAKLELVDGFCCLGGVLSVDGDAGAAVEARVGVGWNGFRQLVPLLTGKNVSLVVRGRLCGGRHVAWKWGLACGEGKCGGTSASRDGGGQVDVWR